MKDPRAQRPTPRTLSATPPQSSRAPRSASHQTRFPSLVAVIAGGALVPACHEVECGTTRADELQAHGSGSMRELRNGQVREAMREIGVATGIVAHRTTQATAAGAVAPVTPTPTVVPPVPPPVEPRLITAGEPMPVGPAPIAPTPPQAQPLQPPTPTHVVPAPTQVPPTHRSPARGGARRVEPRPEPRALGELGVVGPLPSDSSVLARRV